MKGKAKSLNRLLILICLLSAVLFLPGKVEAATKVASIGRKNYTSLQKAINEVKDGQTIKLLKNLSFNNFGFDPELTSKKNISYTINLNNHKLFANNKGSSFPGYLIDIRKGNVTIKNGTLRGYITVQKRGSLFLNKTRMSGTEKSLIDNLGKLRLKRAEGNLRIGTAEKSKTTLENCKLSYNSNMIMGKGTVTVKGGTYTCKSKTNTPLIILDGSGTLTIESGTFTSKNSLIIDTEIPDVIIKGGTFTSDNEAVAIMSGPTGKYGKVNISGGTFTTNKKSEYTGYSYEVTGQAVAFSDVNAVISGGTFISTTYIPDPDMLNKHWTGSGTVVLSTGNLSITGGTFSGNSLSPVLIWAAAGSFSCNGATLKTNCADGTLIVDHRKDD